MASQAQRGTDWKKTLLALLVVLVILGLAGLLVWLIIIILRTLQAGVAAAIITGVFTVLISVFSLIYSKQHERRQEIEQEHRKQKQPVYEDFMEFLFKLFLGSKQGTPLTQKEIAESISKFTQKLIIWGADDVLKEFYAFQFQTRVLAANQGSQSDMVKTMVVFDRLLQAIRTDLGHETKNLKPGAIISLFINDFDKYADEFAKVAQEVPGK